MIAPLNITKTDKCLDISLSLPLSLSPPPPYCTSSLTFDRSRPVPFLNFFYDHACMSYRVSIILFCEWSSLVYTITLQDRLGTAADLFNNPFSHCPVCRCRSYASKGHPFNPQFNSVLAPLPLSSSCFLLFSYFSLLKIYSLVGNIKMI